jgi:hypothetical protein
VSLQLGTVGMGAGERAGGRADGRADEGAATSVLAAAAAGTPSLLLDGEAHLLVLADGHFPRTPLGSTVSRSGRGGRTPIRHERAARSGPAARHRPRRREGS